MYISLHVLLLRKGLHHDGHCKAGYMCHHQDQKSPIPGCEGTPEEAMDYCVRHSDVAEAAAAAP